MGGGDDAGLVASPSVNETNVLVLARGCENISVEAPRKVLGELLVSRKCVDILALLYVPNLDRLVATTGGEHIAYGGVELQEGHLAAVALEVDEGFGEVLRRAASEASQKRVGLIYDSCMIVV